MLRQFLLLIILFFITGCVQSSPTTSSTTIHRSAQKVGYLVNVRAYPTHTHIGTTALTNFTKNYPFGWKIPSYIERQLDEKLKTFAGVYPVNLRKKGINPNEINNLIKNVNGIWMVARGKSEAYKRVTKQLGLSAIVIVNESAKQAIRDCGMLGCKEFKASGYGVVTRSFLNSNKFYSATAFYANVYKLNPLGSLNSQLTAINESKKMTLVAISKGSIVEENKINFIYPQNFNRWTEQEFKPFRAPLIRYIDEMTQKIIGVVRDN
ncbi:hypothetical protein GSY74_07550 [Sulfurovum sp. bin170]|uniref:hypothetical protein n=1 Tax=Sulfurovum sp. bin170 TaxID=2695268 RepID=UPI0013E01690|nr:hypothetical protein [Sulfurovum sp. bin170]NEW61133.1 hypothetical protein [Sulfurovum sp. bin170]